MKSKIRVEFDFDAKEPFIQLYLDDTNEPGTQPDMRDQMLKNFIDTAKFTGIEVISPIQNQNNQALELRPMSDWKALELSGGIIASKLMPSMIDALWNPIVGAMWADDGKETQALDVMKDYLLNLLNPSGLGINTEQRKFINDFFDWVKTPTPYPVINQFSQPVSKTKTE